MTINKLSVLLFTFFIINLDICFSQNTLEHGPTKIQFRLRNSETIENTTGTPYIQKEFVGAKINDLDLSYLVRYNAAKDVMEFREDKYNSQIMILESGNNYRIVLNGEDEKVYVTFKFKIDPTGFFVEEHIADSFSLYKKEKISFYPAVETVNSYTKSVQARYERDKDSFYVRLGNDNLMLIPRKKSKFKKQFASLKTSMNIKLINPTQKDDLVHFFQSVKYE